MVDYDFKSLSDKEFEVFSADLLSLNIGQRVERFRPGKDAGVDGRFFVAPNQEAIIQCKHYTSGFISLLSALNKKNKNGESEVDKVARLNPSKYILVTSAPLSRANKEKLENLFAPFLKSQDDIYGCEDLNDLLKQHPEVEKRFYKLWLTSTTVLDAILHNDIQGRSRFCIEEILDKAKIFVQTPSFDAAMVILQSTRVLVLEGEPGIGKTTLAESLSYQFTAQGFEFVFIDREIKDVEDVIAPGKKQLFYFDDFLGHNYLDILTNNSESTIMNIIRRVRKSGTKFLILTTRTNILSQAKLKYDLFSNSNIEMHEHILTMAAYSREDRAKILYNHMYFSGLPDDYINEFFYEKRYLQIIDHKNYNPRLIEQMCDPHRALVVSPEKYWKVMLESLNNPQAVWLGSYENQLNEEERFIIESMFSLGDQVTESRLKTAFEKRLDYEISKANHKPSPNPFFNGIKTLLDIFLKRYMPDKNTAFYTFFNPSIADFMLNYLRNNEYRRRHILASAIYIEQVTTRFAFSGEDKVILNPTESRELAQSIVERIGTWQSMAGKNVQLAVFIAVQKASEEIAALAVASDLLEIDLTLCPSSTENIRDYLSYIKTCIKVGKLKSIMDNIEVVIENLFRALDDPNDIQHLLDVFRGPPFDEILEFEQLEDLKSKAISFLEDYAEEMATSNEDVTSALTDDDMEEAIDGFRDTITDYLFTNDLPFDKVDSIVRKVDFDKILDDNRENMADAAYEEYSPSTPSEMAPTIDSIEDMFTDWRE